MKIICESKGGAREYAYLAVNLYTGCPHACRYCYGPSVLHKKRTSFYFNLMPKDEALVRLRQDVEELNLNQDDREILMSFVTDPYHTFEKEHGVTRKAIKIFIENDLPFTILTKGGTRAIEDFDLLERSKKARFGSSLIFLKESDAKKWEPNAPTVEDRIIAIEEAHCRGIPTWVSLEPVIDPNQAFDLIHELHPIVDHWKVGKINHRNEIENQVDWIAFREGVIELLESMDASYYIKNSLTDL